MIKFTCQAKDSTRYPNLLLRALVATLMAWHVLLYGYGYSFDKFLGLPHFMGRMLCASITGILLVEYCYYINLYTSRFMEKVQKPLIYLALQIFGQFIAYSVLLGCLVVSDNLFGVDLMAGVFHGTRIFAFLNLLLVSMFLASLYTLYRVFYYSCLSVRYGLQDLILPVMDIAYIFYQDRTFFVTAHSGITYQADLDKSFEEIAEKLDPHYFFVINVSYGFNQLIINTY